YEIDKFIYESSSLPLSYQPIGLAKGSARGFKIDVASAVVGRGENAFARAQRALSEWRHFELGWVELFPRSASTEPGTIVAVLANHLWFWSLNGCRVVYSVAESKSSSRFGFAYG